MGCAGFQKMIVGDRVDIYILLLLLSSELNSFITNVFITRSGEATYTNWNVLVSSKSANASLIHNNLKFTYKSLEVVGEGKYISFYKFAGAT